MTRKRISKQTALGFKAVAQALAMDARYRLAECARVAGSWEWPLIDPEEFAMRSNCLALVYNRIGSLTSSEWQQEDRRLRAYFYHQQIQEDHNDCERCGTRRTA